MGSRERSRLPSPYWTLLSLARARKNPCSEGGRWLRRTGIDPYDPLTDDDAISLAYPSSTKANRRELMRRAWSALERLEEYGELRIEGRRMLPPVEESTQ